jgi:hypothetical protein
VAELTAEQAAKLGAALVEAASYVTALEFADEAARLDELTDQPRSPVGPSPWLRWRADCSRSLSTPRRPQALQYRRYKGADQSTIRSRHAGYAGLVMHYDAATLDNIGKTISWDAQYDRVKKAARGLYRTVGAGTWTWRAVGRPLEPLLSSLPAWIREA